MNFNFFIISIILTFGFVGIAFAQTMSVEKEFSQEEIDEMKHTAVYIGMSEGSFLIELFPEDAPNTVNNFLKLIESGYYDGVVFHRIIPGFMIQVGDPNTKDPESDRSLWGQGGPGYTINEEFNTIQHDRGIVSMARGNNPNSAGSQFFIVHQDSNFLDGEYTAFGRLVPISLNPTLPGSFSTLDMIANLETDQRTVPLDTTKAMIIKASIVKDFSVTDLAEPDRNQSIVKKINTIGGTVDKYFNQRHGVSFNLPILWAVVNEGTEDYLDVVLQPTVDDHNVQPQIEKTGFTPQVLISSEEATLQTASFFYVKGGEAPKIISNHIFENDDGIQAHMMVSTQNLTFEWEDQSTKNIQFKTIELHFTNSELNYSIIYLNTSEWFRYEINAFVQTVTNFEIMLDGKMQPINFSKSPVFRQLITDAKAKPEPESLPPVRIGGCLIATASYGSELAPQVQQLRELRDNTVLQTESGAAFMTGFNQFYYSFSPMIADYERENPAFKEAVKLTITPLLISLTLLQHADIDSEHEMLVYGIAVILLNIGMYFIAPAVLITKIRSFYKLQ